MSLSVSNPVDDDVIGVSQLIQELLTAKGIKTIEVKLERSDYARFKGEIKVTWGYKE